VRPGDASVAAPFTSRAPSVRNLVDLIRQGRCTLLSALQQQQIMMLESLISAYAPISPLYLPYISLHLRVRPLGHNPYPYLYLYPYPYPYPYP